MTKNDESTRYYSTIHEQSVAKELGGHRQPNSGATDFEKMDVIIPDIETLIECKTTLKDQKSFSVKKDWFTKSKQELKNMHLRYNAFAFNFGPGQENYYIIDAKLMKFLVESMRKDDF